MLIDFTDKEICLIYQSIQDTDWDYSGNGDTAKSVLQKLRAAAQRALERQKGPANGD